MLHHETGATFLITANSLSSFNNYMLFCILNTDPNQRITARLVKQPRKSRRSSKV